jgi:predicted kinase
MTRLFGLCGLAFSGKTTLARALCRQAGAEYVGLDEINEERGLRGGEGIPGEEWEKTSNIAIERAEAFLASGRDVVLDDTLCFRWLRDRYAAVAARHGAQLVLLYVATPLPEILEAMAENETHRRRQPIRPDVFEVHARGFEPPTADERPLVYDRTLSVEDWIVRHC